MSNEPTMTADQAAAAIAGKTAPKVTKESITDKIADATYIYHNELTICILTTSSGFTVLGHEAPASPANYDKAIGERLAYDDAFRQLWPLEGYLLKDRLFAAAATATQAEIDARQQAKSET